MAIAVQQMYPVAHLPFILVQRQHGYVGSIGDGLGALPQRE